MLFSEKHNVSRTCGWFVSWHIKIRFITWFVSVSLIIANILFNTINNYENYASRKFESICIQFSFKYHAHPLLLQIVLNDNKNFVFKQKKVPKKLVYFTNILCQGIMSHGSSKNNTQHLLLYVPTYSGLSYFKLILLSMQQSTVSSWQMCLADRFIN